MSLIIQSLLQHLPYKKKPSPSGWVSFNAVCCHHRGHKADHRGRGGVLATADVASYHCFNCGFKTKYTVGSTLSESFVVLLKWLHVDETEIGRLRLQSIKDKDFEVTPTVATVTVTHELPKSLIPLDATQHPTAWQYLQARSINPGCYDFYVSTQDPLLKNRIIIPFKWQSQNIGYIARSWTTARPKYIRQLSMPYVFGLDLQKPQYTWVPVVEGVFDALSIGGCAVLGSELHPQQIKQIQDLNKKPVVVPDRDAAGTKLVYAAMEQQWAVSFPDWPPEVKDVNDAVVKFGSLYTLRTIWQAATTNHTKIKLLLMLSGRH